MNFSTRNLKVSLMILVFMGLPTMLFAQEKLNIIATIPDLGNLVEIIGGDRVAVEVLVKPGSDPHSVLPKASMLLKLSRADGLVVMGIDYEHAFLPAMLEKCRNAAISPGAVGYMNVGERIEVLEVPKSLDRGAGADLHPRGNPHYNLDPENGRIMAAAVRDLLQAMDPACGAAYQQRWEVWDELAKEKIVEWKKLMEPLRGSKIVVYHNSWPYFTKFFGLEVAAFVEPKPGISPSAAHLIQVRRIIEEQKIRVILMEPWYSAASIKNLRAEGVQVLQLSTAVGARKDSQSYLQMMDALVKDLRVGFGIPIAEEQ
jgi:zinc/manganese transport system substrate-binding protein